MAVWPCCGENFRLVDGGFLFPLQQQSSCVHPELGPSKEKASDAEDRMAASKRRFGEILQTQRQRLIDLGRRKAKGKLKRIGPPFSDRNIEFQDAKVICVPLGYLVFRGLNSPNGFRFAELTSRVPANRKQEAITQSLGNAGCAGMVEFETLHMQDDGSFEIRSDMGTHHHLGTAPASHWASGCLICALLPPIDRLLCAQKRWGVHTKRKECCFPQ